MAIMTDGKIWDSTSRSTRITWLAIALTISKKQPCDLGQEFWEFPFVHIIEMFETSLLRFSNYFQFSKFNEWSLFISLREHYEVSNSNHHFLLLENLPFCVSVMYAIMFFLSFSPCLFF
jgi:hypothetical protein